MNLEASRKFEEPHIQTILLGGSSHLVCGLVHPSYKWTLPPLIPLKSPGLYNPLTIRGMNHQVPIIGQKPEFKGASKTDRKVWMIPRNASTCIEPVHLEGRSNGILYDGGLAENDKDNKRKEGICFRILFFGCWLLAFGWVLVL